MRIAHLLGATALTLAPLAAQAQAQGAPSLWELLKPEFLVQRIVQTGIMALRTQMDVKYGAMAVDLRLGQVSLTDITVWPLVDWDSEGLCSIEFDRLTIRAAPLNRPDLVRLKLQAQGVSAPDACLPPDQRQVLSLVALEELNMPRLTIDMEYDISQAEADVHAYTQIDGVAALDITADMSYLWFDGRDDMEEPEPVMYLRRAAVTLENLGGFEALKGMIPPPFLDPAQAPVVLEGMVGQAIGGMNRDAAPADATGDPSALNDAQLAFIASLKESWPAFLENPSVMVLETGFDPQDDVYVDFFGYETNPGLAFQDLQPRLSLAPAPARAALPVALVQQALGDGASTMANEDLRRVGTALITGVGAPRSVSAGTGILTGLAEAGDGAAAQELSAALEQRDPAQSYRWALVAGGDSYIGAAARLDRLETVLPFAEVLAIQTEVLGDVQHSLETLQSVSAMRSEAMRRLSGIGRERSYSVAALWAIMGAAAGDSESRDILDQLDERVSMADDAGQAAWAEVETAASDLAMQAWLGQDLATRFGGN